jgi:PAS domain S-box-containing protein
VIVHRLLRRQLTKIFGSTDAAPAELSGLLEVIDAAYRQSDHDRELLERSLDLTSKELLEANRELRNYASDLEASVAERTAELRAANKALEREIDERIAAERAVGESEERYRAIFEGSKDAIYISTPGGRIIDINQAGLDLLGFDSLESLREVDVARDIYRRAEDRQAMLDELDRNGYLRDAEIEIVRRDGRVITVLDTTTAVRDERGEAVAYRGVLRDVTEQRRLEHDLNQAQKMEAVGRLAGGVAHDFNNILTAILGYASRLATNRGDDDEVRTVADAVAAAADRGSELTNQLLAFGRRQVLRPIVLDLNHAIEDMRELVRRVIPEDVEIVTELDSELRPIEVDRTQIEQVIVNLAINAGDAMPNGGTLTIRTRHVAASDENQRSSLERSPGGFVRLEVEDTGVGIEPAICDRIFEPFFTTKRGSRGTGLGLATVYHAMEQAGGSVEVTSEVGSGTRFDLVFPASARSIRADQPKPPPEIPTTGTESVLIVEDDPAVQSVLREYLTDRGFSVHAADDGLAGLELARREGIRLDLVLSDVVMPKMSGIEMARRLREELPHLKVLLISGHAKDREKAVEESMQDGFCAFLQKPFAPETLARRIRDLLDAT